MYLNFILNVIAKATFNMTDILLNLDILLDNFR